MFPDAVPCYAGCSHCCYTLFAVTPLDTALVSFGIASQSGSSGKVKQIQNIWSALQHQYQFTHPFRIEDYGWDHFEKLVNREKIKCPLLTSDGKCAIYPFRPKICRLAGLKYRDSQTGVELDDFCDLAKKARIETGLDTVNFSLADLDQYVMEFEFLFRRTVKHKVISGKTVIPAGVIEFFPKIEAEMERLLS